MESESIPVVTVVKKKRGRQPKNKEHVGEIENKLQDTNTNTNTNTNVDGLEKVEEKPKSKRGRKKKEKVEEEVKVKKKRGRKAALKFYSSSIRKKIPIKTDLQNNENIILHIENLQIDDNLESSIFDKNDIQLQKQHDFIVLNNSEDDTEDILEEYLNELDKDPELTLKSLYDNKIEQRQKEDNDILEKLHDISNNNNPEEISKVLNSLKIGKEKKTKVKNVDTDTNNSNDIHRKKGFMILFNDLFENGGWLDSVKHKNIKCWWCCHTFKETPLGLPVRFDASKNKFLVKGCFCSIACVYSYYKNSKYRFNLNILPLIKSLYRKLTGSSTDDDITPAPPKEVLKEFGGELNIDEFRESSKNNKIYKMMDYPLIIIKEYIEEVDLGILKEKNKISLVSNHTNSKKLVLHDLQIKDAKSRLSMIEKPAVENTIDKFLNCTF
jgi:hypothetical protein